VVTFLNNIFQIKTNVGGLNKEFFTIWDNKKMGLKKALKGVYIV
jgi:hypothetical protein